MPWPRSAVSVTRSPSRVAPDDGRAPVADDHPDLSVAFGRVDLLVNNAGINPVYGPMIEMDLAAARKIFEVNALAALS